MTKACQPKAIIRSPRRPSWARYQSLFWDRRALSVHRALQYEALERVKWGGDILDIGGGERAHYKSIIEQQPGVSSYQSINMDPLMEPTYLKDFSEPFEIPEQTYDMVISLNTLEHVRRPDQLIRRMSEVLGPDGRLLIVVPFLIRVHASPHDYVRLTASWWMETLAEVGYNDIVVEPLVWDPITSAAAVAEEVGPFRMVRRLLSPFYGLLYATIKGGRGERYPSEIGEKIGEFALSYLVEARWDTKFTGNSEQF